MTEELTIFQYGGETYIGYLCTYTSSEANKPTFAGLGNKFDNYYAVKLPCKLTFTVTQKDSETARIEGNLSPVFPANKYQGTAANVMFAYPKADTVVSTIKNTQISSDIINAYRAIVQLA